MKNPKKVFSLCLVLSVAGFSSHATKIKPSQLKYSGPVEVVTPWQTDGVDVNNKPYAIENVLDEPFVLPLQVETINDTVMILGGDKAQVHYLSFPVQNSRFAEIDIDVEGSKNYKVYVDGKESSGKIKAKPGLRNLTVQLLTLPSETDTVSLSLSSPQSDYVTINLNEPGRLYTLDDVMYAPHIRSALISPSGNYVIMAETETAPDHSVKHKKSLLNAKTLKQISRIDNDYQWLPDKDLLWKTVDAQNNTVDIMVLDPATQAENIFAKGVPDGDFFIAPGGSYLIYATLTKGRTEDADIYRIVNPEDRQPGWRDRRGVAMLDLATGSYRPITFGNKNISVEDISKDGKKLLLMSMRNRFEKRPTTVFSLYEYDLTTNKVDTLVAEDGFITSAAYSPDARKVLITGSPESLGGAANTLPDSKIPNMTEGEFFILDIESGNIVAPTRDFNPSVTNAVWPASSEKIFFTAEDKDKVNFFTYDPSTRKFFNMNVPEDLVNSFSVSDNGTAGFLVGESAVNPDVLYSFDFKKGEPIYTKVKASGDQLLSEVRLAKVENWDFVNTRGDTINGRFYLPPDFDPNKKYPLIVNYYGGCSPTSRLFASRYPHHLYATNGYVVYVLNPSGATGFGQEFASRHVNTAGEGVAQDIIEGTTKFAEEHPFIDKEKIGCIGASYGGFMSQYLQTVSDIFAAAISHAGISDHTSYWGNGYWGYSYSEVSMAESYPWKNKELFVEQSPLYNADKINTPILFLHGDADTNVPPDESLQLFTALTLLGKDTALVNVTDQNHHILDIDKRTKWQDAIFAWFAKYLQDDPGWWNEMFPTTPY